ncbi:hypothetical protein ACH4U3_28520 [Streptomyces griseoruber]|uniref:hypothetical protein n=1 Tax=Streptomyces griseoruber TaxID=1943 RepID=UPI0037B49292
MSHVVAVGARMRCMTRAITPPGVRPRHCAVLVAGRRLSGPGGDEVRFGGEQIQQGLAFVGLGPGQGEGDGQDTVRPPGSPRSCPDSARKLGSSACEAVHRAFTAASGCPLTQIT